MGRATCSDRHARRSDMTALVTPDTASGHGNPADHLWMHFARMGNYADKPVPIVERGEGAYIYDAAGRRYLDALSALFVVQAGYGRDEIAAAADQQTRKLAYFPIWSYATPPAIELAERLAALAPGDLNKVFFSSGGGESVERPAGNHVRLRQVRLRPRHH